MLLLGWLNKKGGIGGWLLAVSFWRLAVRWNTDDTDWTDLYCFFVHRLH